MLIGERLEELRDEQGLGQRELGALVGVSARSISSYENNHATPEDDVKLALAKHFDVSLDYLMGLTDERCSYTRKDVIVLPKGFPAHLKAELRDYAVFLMQRKK